MKKSWKTTVTGIATILGAICVALVAQFDNDVATVPNWGGIVTAITAGIGLISARDNNVSSEEAGAKPN